MTISTAFKESAFDQERSDVILPLLTITHDDLADDIRVVLNNEDIVSNGNTFVALPFEIELPIDDPEAGPRARLSIDNVSQEIVAAVRSITTPASVTIQVVRSTDPDTIELSYEGLELKNVQYDAKKVVGDLSFESFLAEPFPSARFDPARFPGAF